MSRPGGAPGPYLDPGLAFAAASAALLALAVAVGMGGTATFDEAVLQRVRPGRGWGPPQESVASWVDPLSTWHTLAALLLVAGVGSLLRRSWRPVALALLVITGLVALTVVLKLAVPREDPTLAQGPLGAFPSGHVAFCVAVFSAGSLVTSGRVRWWAVLLSVLVGAWSSYVLVVVGFHWLTDCVGGVLVTTVVVTAVRAAMVHPRLLVHGIWRSRERLPALGRDRDE